MVLRRALLGGEVPRGEVAGLLGVKERQARNVTSALLATGALASPTSRAPLRIALSPHLAPRWLPGLYPGA